MLTLEHSMCNSELESSLAKFFTGVTPVTVVTPVAL